MEDIDDLSESSSVRMEREMEDDFSADDDDDGSHNTRDEHNEPVADDSYTNHSSSLNDFHSEIRRMSADADKILESIRHEVNSSSSHSSSSGSRKAKKKKKSSSSATSTTTSSISVVPSTSSPAVIVDDDTVSDEIERLDSVTAAIIRESLDGTVQPSISTSSPLPEIQAAKTLASSSNSKNDEMVSSLETTSPTTTQSEKSSSVMTPISSASRMTNRNEKKESPSSFGTPTLPMERATTAVTTANPTEQASSSFGAKDLSLLELFFQQTAGNHERLTLVVTVVWVAVLGSVSLQLTAPSSQ